MNFEQTYRSMNERIAPDKALGADTLARMARGEKPRHRPRRLRRVRGTTGILHFQFSIPERAVWFWTNF